MKYKKIILLVGMLLTVTLPTFAQLPIQLDLIIAPTQTDSIFQQLAVTELKKKYGNQIKINTYYYIKQLDGNFQSPKGFQDYQEAKRQKLIKQRYPKHYQTYVLARSSERYSPIWEHAAKWADLDSDKIKMLVKQSHDDRLWKDDLEIINRHTVEHVPTIIINGNLVSSGPMGLALLDNEIKNIISPSQDKLIIKLVIDPFAVQPITANYEHHIKKYMTNTKLEIVSIDDKLEQNMFNQGIYTLPALFVDQAFLTSVYQAHMSTDSPKEVVGLGSYLPLLNEKDTLFVEHKNDNKIDVYIQAHCPYATTLVLQLAKKNKARLNFPSFIINYNDQTKQYNCYHGEDELEETIRQLVIQKYYPDVYCDYFKNLYSNQDKDWKSSVKAAKINNSMLDQQIDQFGQQLLSEHYIKIKNIPLLQSPTVIYEGRYIINNVNQYFEQHEISLTGTCGH